MSAGRPARSLVAVPIELRKLICGLFNKAVITGNYIALNEGMNYEVESSRCLK
jgi:hypothetical protein